MNSFWLFLAGLALSWGMAALSVTWLAGDVGLLSLGHSGFLAAGAYAFVLAVNAGVPWPVALMLAALASGLLGSGLGRLGGAARGTLSALLTLGFGLAVPRLALLLGVWTGGSQGLALTPLPGLGTDASRLAVTILLALLAYVTAVGWQRGYLGACWRLQRDRADVATSFGLSPLRLRRLALSLSAAVTGLAGASLALHAGFVSPYDHGLGSAFQLIVAVALGGIGSLSGAFVAAFGLAVVPSLAGQLSAGLRPEWMIVGQGLLLLAALRFWPWLKRRGRGQSRAVGGQLPDADDSLMAADDQQPGETGDTGAITAWLDRAGVTGRPGSLAVTGLTAQRAGFKLGRLDFTLSSGTVTFLRGQNGAGKSTLLAALSGHLAAAGKRGIDQSDIAHLSPSQVARHGLVRTWQGGGLASGLTVGEHLAAAAWAEQPLWRAAVPGLTWRSWLQELYAAASLGGPLAGLAARPAAAISGGQAGLVQLLAAARRRPAVLLLDEPFAGMGAAYRPWVEAVLGRLQADGTAVLIVEHRQGWLEGAETWWLDGGKLATTAPEPLGRSGVAITGGDVCADRAGSVVLRLLDLRYGHGTGPDVCPPINLTIEAGIIIGITGPNGSGKSTLLQVLSGQLAHRGGRLIWRDMTVLSGGIRESLAHGIVLMPQRHAVFPELTVAENLQLAAGRLDRQSRREAVQQVLTTLPPLAGWRHRLAGRLSGGQQQLLGLARALLLGPKLLLLDEPTAGLDTAGRDLVIAALQRLREQGTAVLIVEQNEAWLAAVADEQYLLSAAGLQRVPASATGVAT